MHTINSSHKSLRTDTHTTNYDMCLYVYNTDRYDIANSQSVRPRIPTSRSTNWVQGLETIQIHVRDIIELTSVYYNTTTRLHVSFNILSVRE